LGNYRAITLIEASSLVGLIQGWDVSKEREVALKVVSYELSSEKKFCEAFIKEAQAVSQLDHPNIAQIFHVSTNSDILYYATEFVNGFTLEDLIARQGNVNIQIALEYLITVCKTLSYVHENEIVHRDIKPTNIMIENDDVIKIIDFGVGFSTTQGKKDKKGLLRKTSVYMPPEQVAGLALDYRSDIYSVGATFYEAFTGVPPYDAKNLAEAMSQIIETPPPTIKEINSNIPPALSQIIEKMMAKAPSDRYEDFKSILNDLNAYQSESL
jgi:serine/threonine protein kinase